MDIVCRVLSQYQLIDREEEENLRKEVKNCIYKYSATLNKILYNEKYNNIDLSKVYSIMCVTNIGHIIAFYCVLELYNKSLISNKTKEEKENYIVQLTIASSNDFSMYKKKKREKENLSSLFYQYIKSINVGYFIFDVASFIIQL